jgi:transcriptional regulator CtsR
VESKTGGGGMMKIILGDLELTAEYIGANAEYIGANYGDCYIIIQVKDDSNERKIRASELLLAIETLKKTCWRP